MEVNRALTNWRSLTAALAAPDITEEQCSQLLQAEKQDANRLAFVTRIYGKYQILRRDRELREHLGAQS